MADEQSIRDELADEISGIVVGSGYYSTFIGIDAAQEAADAIMPLIRRVQAEVWDEADLAHYPLVMAVEQFIDNGGDAWGNLDDPFDQVSALKNPYREEDYNGDEGRQNGPGAGLRGEVEGG